MHSNNFLKRLAVKIVHPPVAPFRDDTFFKAVSILKFCAKSLQFVCLASAAIFLNYTNY